MNAYETVARLWDDYEHGIEEHACSTEEFTRCEICERSWEARTRLGYQLDMVLGLLERYHDALNALTESVIQDVPVPRPESVQAAMLRALAVLKC